MRHSSTHKKALWMPLYIADYLLDTQHLNAAEHGAYLLMLINAWKHDGALPDDNERLRMISRMDKRQWKKSEEVIRAFFYSCDGKLRNKRLDYELENSADRITKSTDQKSKAGKISAAKRKAAAALAKAAKAPSAQHTAPDTPTQNTQLDSQNHTVLLNENSTAVQRPFNGNNTQSQSQYLTKQQVVQLSNNNDNSEHNRAQQLCKTLKKIGINATPQMPIWPKLLLNYSDDVIIACAEQAIQRKPGERLHIHYLLPMLEAQHQRYTPEPENLDQIDFYKPQARFPHVNFV